MRSMHAITYCFTRTAWFPVKRRCIFHTLRWGEGWKSGQEKLETWRRALREKEAVKKKTKQEKKVTDMDPPHL